MPRRFHSARAGVAWLLVGCATFLKGPGAPPARAAVAVVSNRTSELLTVDAVVDGEPRRLTLGPEDSRPIFAAKSLTLRWQEGETAHEAPLCPACAYFLGREAPGAPLRLTQIGLHESPGVPLVLPSDDLLRVAVPVLRIKAYVDDDELRRPEAWEPALRARIAAASEVIQAHCGVKLEVTGFGSWDSDDQEHDFFRSFAEFEREVPRGTADVVIGFSSQYAVERGRFHMGGTRAPLYSHIMLKERARGILETERLELLVHELGHLLGAAHSPEPGSVMRPVLTGALQRTAGARVRFDPVNTLAMSLVADEMRLRRIRSIGEATAATRTRLTEIYAALDPTLPDDPAASAYQQLVGSAAGSEIIQDARKVIAQLDRVAQFHDRAVPEENAADVEKPRSDRLLEWYVKQAAAASLRVRKQHAEKAFLLALGAVLDDQGTLGRVPLVANVERRLEGGVDRKLRAAALGGPTMRGREDLPKHFFVSGHLVVILGSEGARGAGLLKEFADANGGSGFSFVDMTANRAGIVFATALLTGRLSLEQVAREFTVADVLPQLEGLNEGFQLQEFAKDFGGLDDARLQGELAKIEARVAALPLYSGAAVPMSGGR